jgi:hypothetical protein
MPNLTEKEPFFGTDTKKPSSSPGKYYSPNHEEATVFFLRYNLRRNPATVKDSVKDVTCSKPGNSTKFYSTTISSEKSQTGCPRPLCHAGASPTFLAMTRTYRVSRLSVGSATVLVDTGS